MSDTTSKHFVLLRRWSSLDCDRKLTLTRVRNKHWLKELKTPEVDMSIVIALSICSKEN